MNIKILLKLTVANIKMYFRDRGAIIWTLIFPLIVIGIFGVLDFAKFGTSKVGLVYNDKSSQFVLPIKKVLESFEGNYQIYEGSLDEEKKALENDDRLIVLEFKEINAGENVIVNAYINKSNEQMGKIAFLLIQQVFSQIEFELKKVEPMFLVSQQVVNVHNLRNIDYFVPGVVGMSIMQGAIFGVVGTIVNYREKRILKRLFATPLSKADFLISHVLARLVISVFQVIILLVSAYAVFQVKIVGSVFLFSFLAVLGSLLFLTIGFVVSAISKSAEASRAIVMPIQMIMMFTSGVYFSRDLLPKWLFKLSSFLPLTYFSDALRGVMTKGYNLLEKDLLMAVVGMSVWFIAMVLLAIFTFRLEE